MFAQKAKIAQSGHTDPTGMKERRKERKSESKRANKQT